MLGMIGTELNWLQNRSTGPMNDSSHSQNESLTGMVGWPLGGGEEDGTEYREKEQAMEWLDGS